MKSYLSQSITIFCCLLCFNTRAQLLPGDFESAFSRIPKGTLVEVKSKCKIDESYNYKTFWEFENGSVKANGGFNNSDSSLIHSFSAKIIGIHKGRIDSTFYTVANRGKQLIEVENGIGKFSYHLSYNRNNQLVKFVRVDSSQRILSRLFGSSNVDWTNFWPEGITEFPIATLNYNYDSVNHLKSVSIFSKDTSKAVYQILFNYKSSRLNTALIFYEKDTVPEVKIRFDKKGRIRLSDGDHKRRFHYDSKGRIKKIRIKMIPNGVFKSLPVKTYAKWLSYLILPGPKHHLLFRLVCKFHYSHPERIKDIQSLF